MENLGCIIGMYFQSISSYNILSGDLTYTEFNKNDFDELALKELPHLSETETKQLYVYLEKSIRNCKNGLIVFEILKYVVKEYLVIRENTPICRYEKILQWRALTRRIGEDLPICAFLSYMTELYKTEWNNFEWRTVVAHDNMQLNRIMQRGISDNHFHLFGSAPSFQLIWIKLMNQVNNEVYLEAVNIIDKKKRRSRYKYSVKYKEESLEKMLFQAALIRVVLYSYLNNLSFIKELVGESQNEEEGYIWIKNILIHDEGKSLYCDNVQSFINSLRLLKHFAQDDESQDYASMGYTNGSINHEFEGERALMYQMLLGKKDGKNIPKYLMDWFYAYLVIKTKFREELVQVNKTIGFENFSQYSKRKGLFLNTLKDDKLMIQHAVRSSFEPGNMKSLEIRISPRADAEKNRFFIQFCDSAIREVFNIREESIEDSIIEKIYYVLHFPKKQDDVLNVESGIVETCRHEGYRNDISKKAEELIKFREIYPQEASRILGIDACAQEIGCRPEVFATVFRKLSRHVALKPVKQWKITYHVGEDWRDAVDGLRAIDEAVHFLDMQNGDRLGHATVLGLNIRKWYNTKKYVLYLPLQEYLDNIVWLYRKIIEFDISGCETLKGVLLAEYDKCFKQLYGKCMIDDYSHYGIDTYFEAWRLRGDNPTLYSTGKFEFSLIENSILDIIHGDDVIRSKETEQLNYYYHYSADVRMIGETPIKHEISDIYIEGVEKIQKHLQKIIAQKGICVETNPSSNYMISTMEKYEEHPICNMFNMGLTFKEDILECPQIHVSINTDDKGVFDTSLENEYALIGCALEQFKDQTGQTIYKKQMVYDWIERIRQNGNQQSFLESTYGEKDIWNY